MSDNARVALAAVIFAAGLLGACHAERDASVGAQEISDRDSAKQLLRNYGCTACHQIPGVDGVAGTVGPSLDHIGTKYQLAGQLPNTHENMLLWIEHPHTVNPKTMMPEMNVRDEDARAMVSYLRTLR